MHKLRYSNLPNDERIIRLPKSTPGILKGKYIVTEVISCAAFMMLLSDKKAENFSVTLEATAPVSSAVLAGRAVDFAWSSEATTGLCRQGSDPTVRYIPLYQIQKTRSKFWQWPIGRR
ncbi:hypothetical protein DFH29DRAFT_635950 [Suillus ampliporus]|nr:hypothetical protein DFH29DRAFT_635950 [Suillus ampliporus]